jgi:hypothetical protein
MAGDSTGESSSNDMLGDNSGDSETGIGLIARADIPEIGPTDIGTAGDSGRGNRTGAGGIGLDSVEGDDISDGGPSNVSAGGGSTGGSSTRNKYFAWPWVLGLMAVLGVPLLYLGRRRQKKKSLRKGNRLDHKQYLYRIQ